MTHTCTLASVFHTLFSECQEVFLTRFWSKMLGRHVLPSKRTRDWETRSERERAEKLREEEARWTNMNILIICINGLKPQEKIGHLSGTIFSGGLIDHFASNIIQDIANAFIFCLPFHFAKIHSLMPLLLPVSVFSCLFVIVCPTLIPVSNHLLPCVLASPHQLCLFYVIRPAFI